MRYGDAEGVIDVIVKRRDSGGQVMWNSRNTFDMPWGDFAANIKLNKGRSQFGISASYTIHSYDRSYDSGSETYTYDDGSQVTRIIEGIPSKFKEYYPNINLNYSYSIPDNLLLLARLNYNMWKEGTNKIPSNIFETYNNSLRSIYSNNTRSYKQNKPSFDLYLQKQFKNKDILAVNVVGSYFTTKSERHLLETEENINITDIITDIQGNKYSIIGDVYYEKNFKAGQLSAGFKHTVEYSDNTYSGSYNSEIDLTQNKSYLYAQWMGKWKKLVYSVGVGGIVNVQKQSGEKQQVDAYVNPRLRLSYPLSSKTQLRYQGDVRIINPALGNMNNVLVPVNSYLYWQGNPNLQSYASYANTLSLIHTFNKNVGINLNIYDNYTPNGIMDHYFQDGDKIVTQQINGDVLHTLSITAGTNVSLFKDRFNLNVSGGMSRLQSKADAYNHLVHNWYMISQLSYQLAKFTLWSSISTRRYALRGEYMSKGEQLFAAGVDYRYKRLTVGAGYMSNLGTYTFDAIRLSHYYRSDMKSYMPDFKNVVYLRLTWNMRFGKAYKSLGRLKYNEDTDSGVSKQ